MFSKAIVLMWVAGTLFRGGAPGLVPDGRQHGDSLPIVAREADGEGPLALVLTGDGNWAGFERTLADSLTKYGSPVLGVKMRTYLEQVRTPDQAASDTALALRTWLERWHRDHIVVIGYSRGANIAPFVIRRLPQDLRTAIIGVALIGLEDHAGFQFHLEDLIADRHRPTDLDVAPELEAMRDMDVICIHGGGEKHGRCTGADGWMRVFQHGGGHRVAGEADGATSSIILDQFGLRPGGTDTAPPAIELNNRLSRDRALTGCLNGP